jgi:aldose 1-epimerase
VPEPRNPVAPSGEQVEIVHGDQRATVVEVGGALRTYAKGDRAVLDGYAENEMCSSARGHTLVPWPNRIRDGAYRFDGRDHQLGLTEPAQHNAIHGLVRWANWAIAERGDDRVTMTVLLHPQDGYPFALEVATQYVLSADGLNITTTATNVGDSPCPYGAGAHPYLTVGTERLDPAILVVPAETWLRGDERQIPVAAEPVAGTQYDFRAPRAIGDTRLDTGYSDLIRDPDGRARVVLGAPDGGPEVALWLGSAYGYVMAFSGDTLPDVSRRRRGLGVEPMTCAPNAFQSGEGLQRLQPGESAVSSWGIEPGPGGAAGGR